MSHWQSKCKKCGNIAHVVIGRKPVTGCPRCSAPVDAVIEHTGANRKKRRAADRIGSTRAQRMAARR